MNRSAYGLSADLIGASACMIAAREAFASASDFHEIYLKVERFRLRHFDRMKSRTGDGAMSVRW